MSEAAHAGLQRALQITIEMLDAAAGNNWDRVIQLDAERQNQLRKRAAGPLGDQDRQLIATMRRHNQMLVAQADLARSALKQQLDQHQYKHHALRTYISSSR
jgi:hypothetical protein